jgi:hypothetical protein
MPQIVALIVGLIIPVEIFLNSKFIRYAGGA